MLAYFAISGSNLITKLYHAGDVDGGARRDNVGTTFGRDTPNKIWELGGQKRPKFDAISDNCPL